MASLREQTEYFAAMLWHQPMTESEMRTSEAFKNYSVDGALMMLERSDMIYYKGDVIHVKKSVAKNLGNHVHVTISDSCRFCKGSGFVKQSNAVEQVNWPCEKCKGSGNKIVRDH